MFMDDLDHLSSPQIEGCSQSHDPRFIAIAMALFAQDVTLLGRGHDGSAFSTLNPGL